MLRASKSVTESVCQLDLFYQDYKDVQKENKRVLFGGRE